MKILHLEDDADDAVFVQHTVARHGVKAAFVPARSRAEFLAALAADTYDVVIVDNSLPSLRARDAIAQAKKVQPAVPVIVCSGAARDSDVADSFAAGASDYVLKDHGWQLAAALRRMSTANDHTLRRSEAGEPDALPRSATLLLIDVVQRLSLARGLDQIVAIVRSAARQLTGADGATFVLRDGGCCYYVDEDAISPLWKGQRFPLEACISGWAMLNGRSTVIPDIYQDSRIPHAAYRPTFVRSLAMVPIRTSAPIGAIGNYWARHHACTAEQLLLLEALANSTSVAMENVGVYQSLEQQVRDRTRELAGANQELEAFSAAVSHDLRAPLRTMNTVLEVAAESDQALGSAALSKLRHCTQRMGGLIEDLLRLSRAGHARLQLEPLDLGAMAHKIMARLHAAEPGRALELHVAAGATVSADRALLHVVLENLLSNAWKYSAKRDVSRIRFTQTMEAESGRSVFCCSDNGAGFDPSQAAELFKPFTRLHDATEFPGVGIGLTTVQRIIQRHGGMLWAESDGVTGARFMFSLPAGPSLARA